MTDSHHQLNFDGSLMHGRTDLRDTTMVLYNGSVTRPRGGITAPGPVAGSVTHRSVGRVLGLLPTPRRGYLGDFDCGVLKDGARDNVTRPIPGRHGLRVEPSTELISKTVSVYFDIPSEVKELE